MISNFKTINEKIKLMHSHYESRSLSKQLNEAFLKVENLQALRVNEVISKESTVRDIVTPTTPIDVKQLSNNCY